LVSKTAFDLKKKKLFNGSLSLGFLFLQRQSSQKVSQGEKFDFEVNIKRLQV